MKDTSRNALENMLQQQRAYFATNETKSVDFRLKMLKKFRATILKYEIKIAEALWKDLHKSYEEAYLTEVSIVLQEINYHIKHLRRWAKPQRVSTPFHLKPSSSKIFYEPLGASLIIAPWNYPFQLLMNSLVGSISAGNCAILKPSPYTLATALVMEDLIKECFNPNYIGLVQGSRKTNTLLLEQKFDIIFFTGSPYVGKIVMQAAAKHLTPVVLELGGKSPSIVDKEANLAIAAKRIIWGKLINAGQTCIAPDYVFVQESIKEELLKHIYQNIENMYGKEIQESKYFSRIVNEKAFDRLEKLMKHGNITFGGEINKKDRFIAPTIIDNIKPEYPIMQEEIFGPILPILTFKEIDEVIDYVNSNEKPLAFYYFGKNKQAIEVLRQTTSGGGCINDTLMHITNHKLPFGGVGNSGIGKYHGKRSFLAFSNQRAIVSTPTWIDLPVKYVPFKYFKYIKRII